MERFDHRECAGSAEEATTTRFGNRSQGKRHFYGKLKGSGTFFGGHVQQRACDFPPKNEPDPGP